MKKLKEKVLTWANFWTVISLACGCIAYKWHGDTMGDASMVTGTLAFFIGLV